MIKVVTLVGARPQFVKAAVVSKALVDNGNFKEVIVHSGQHYDLNMSQVFFDELLLPKPDFGLGVGSSRHGQQTAEVLERFEKVLMDEQPHLVLLYGDTNTTLGGVLAAVKLRVPIAHVEAGLRSFDRAMPEEINRIVTDTLADFLFVPTDAGLRNLTQEGIDQSRIHLVGDVMQDAAYVFRDTACRKATIFKKSGLAAGEYVLATVHRAENTDNPENLNAITDALIQLSSMHAIVVPLHPRTRSCLESIKRLNDLQRNVQLIEPVGYFDMLELERNAGLIATDSGGVQKEAYFQRVPCVTMRNETEWIELIESGWNRLASPNDANAIFEACRTAFASKGELTDIYGDGQASNKIAEILSARL